MKFFNAINREIFHVETNIKEFEFNIAAKEYLGEGIASRFPQIKAKVKETVVGLEPIDKVLININLREGKDSILTDDEISEIFSNYTMSYGLLFPLTDKQVLLPSESLMKKFTCSPSVISMITCRHVVDNPFQIIINRSYADGDGPIEGEEKVVLV